MNMKYALWVFIIDIKSCNNAIERAHRNAGTLIGEKGFGRGDSRAGFVTVFHPVRLR